MPPVGATPLVEAIYAGGDVTGLINDTSKDELDGSGRSPLMYACLAGNVDAATALCEAGADVNFVCPRNGVSVAHAAGASYGAGDRLVKLLSTKGIDLNVQDVYGYTPLHYCKTGKGAKMLCACGAKYEIADKDGNTAQKHHARNPNNGDAVIVANLLEEYNRKLAEFKLFDVDHDGNLTEAELQAGLRAQQKSEREIKQMWARLELNEQGGVGPREYALMSIAV